MYVEYDALDDFWLVMEDEGDQHYEVAGPFACEQDAYDWIEAFGDD